MSALQRAHDGVLEQSSDPGIRELDDLAWLLDARWRIPGTGIRFGADAVAGLIPGIGDAATGLISAYIVLRAARHDVPKHVLARMVGNVVVDTVVGSVPVLGSVFDLFFKANRRNVRLLRQHLEKTGRPHAR
ncbi:DUF4112 domain-containing protein [Nitratireductor mangrovi]|uniref:DUF4112 domain-containing protein n=1 Tax=Nitratireductor mangrovi TaxID=2599600 RepID=A0A5B8KZJ6_9HYPH|nr:DUF4112 domain-containing protein [Nitratireductor mangrovi]QDZ00758.1 DUF4112 domain-containing protein [Nitratireductor mangrovi]